MTVICWDGKSLAADKQTNDNGLRLKTTKVHRVGDCLVGGCGDTVRVREMVEWLANGRKKDELPAFQRDASTCVTLMVIEKSGKILHFWNSHVPAVIEDAFSAIGSGRDYALAAMLLGCDARRAVEIACHFETGCGNGVDVVSLE